MSRLFENAFARLGHAGSKQAEFARAWAGYIEAHPWEVALDQVADDTFEMTVRTREATPVSLSLAFGDWLTALRSALDNALYAWAVTLSGQDPPPDAGRLQFPIATTATEFGEQARCLRSLPADVVAKLEKAQPYHSAFGHETNTLFWLHELARIDRHRALHIGLGRVAEHRVGVWVPADVQVRFDQAVQPYEFIDDQLVIARFTTSRGIEKSQVTFNPAIGIDPEIKEWARFRLNGSRVSLHQRTTMSELFVRNHLENMALFAGVTPPGGFEIFDLTSGAD